MDSTDFYRYLIDCIKYSMNSDLLNQQLNYLREVNDSVKVSPSQLDEKIADNNKRVAKLTTDIADKQKELIKLKNELRSLQFIEAQSKCARKVYDDGKCAANIWNEPLTELRQCLVNFSFDFAFELSTAIESTHCERIRDSANEFSHAAQRLETRLGCKLKLAKCEESNENLWLAKFLFDTNAIESKKYVVFRVDVTGSNFTRKF